MMPTHQHASRFMCYLDGKWTSNVFHTTTWRNQYHDPFNVPIVDLSMLEEMALQNWRFKPRGAGRPKADNRTEVQVVGANAHRCGSCRELGHNSGTCKKKDLDLIFKKTTGISTYYHEPVADVAPEMEEDVRDEAADPTNNIGLHEEGNLGLALRDAEEIVCEGENSSSSSAADQNASGSEEDSVRDVVFNIHLVMEAPPIMQEADGYPCCACHTKRIEQRGVWRVILCDFCKRAFHLRNDCANPRPTIDQRKDSKAWTCLDCLNK